MNEFAVNEDPEPLSYERSWLDENYGHANADYSNLIEQIRARQTKEEASADIDICEREEAERKRLVNERWPLGSPAGHIDAVLFLKSEETSIARRRRTTGRNVVQRFFTNLSPS